MLLFLIQGTVRGTCGRLTRQKERLMKFGCFPINLAGAKFNGLGIASLPNNSNLFRKCF